MFHSKIVQLGATLTLVGHSSSDKVYDPLPLYHTAGMIGLTTSLLQGFHLLLNPHKKPVESFVKSYTINQLPS